MNKPAPKIIYTRQPVANMALAPVVRFRNTSDEGNNVKRYLENVKKHHQPELLHRIEPKETEQEAIGQMNRHLKVNQAILRQRITELEMENNQFRGMAVDYEKLALRNKELEEQMLLLLNQLQTKQDQPLQSQDTPDDMSRKYRENQSTEQRQFNTQESSHQNVDHYSYSNSYQLSISPEKEHSPFRNIVIEGEANRMNNSILEENSFLQSNQIKEMVDESIKVSIKQLENRFMAYIQSIEAQIGEIKSTNEEIIRFKLRASSSSDSKGSVRSEEALRKASNWPLNIENQQFFRHSEAASVSSGKKDPSSEIFNLPENSSMKKKESLLLDLPEQSSIKKDEFHLNLPEQSALKASVVNIDVQNLSESNYSFNKSMFYQPESRMDCTPDADPKAQEPVDQSVIAFSRDPFQDRIIDVIKGRVYEGLESLRQNLTYILGENSKLADSSIQTFEQRIHKQLNNILLIFFHQKSDSSPLNRQDYEQDRPSKSEYYDLLSENSKNRNKIQELTEQILTLRLQFKRQADDHSSIPDSKLMSERYLEKEYYKSLPVPGCCQDFIQTERRLIEVIEVMKSFNKEYQNLLCSRSASARNQPLGYFKESE